MKKRTRASGDEDHSSSEESTMFRVRVSKGLNQLTDFSEKTKEVPALIE